MCVATGSEKGLSNMADRASANCVSEVCLEALYREARRKFREEWPGVSARVEAEDAAPQPAGESLVGFLEFSSPADELQDYISLCDEGRPGEMGGMGLVMRALKQFHGKEVVLTVTLLHPEQEK
jgi:hypothetical protein